jgi:uncharacterized membrane protein
MTTTALILVFLIGIYWLVLGRPSRSARRGRVERRGLPVRRIGLAVTALAVAAYLRHFAVILLTGAVIVAIALTTLVLAGRRVRRRRRTR